MRFTYGSIRLLIRYLLVFLFFSAEQPVVSPYFFPFMSSDPNSNFPSFQPPYFNANWNNPSPFTGSLFLPEVETTKEMFVEIVPIIVLQ